MLALLSARAGDVVRIIKFDAGDGMQTRLKHLGLMQGDVVHIVQNARGGIIVAKDNLRLALGRGISQKIIVEKADRK